MPATPLVLRDSRAYISLLLRRYKSFRDAFLPRCYAARRRAMLLLISLSLRYYTTHTICARYALLRLSSMMLDAAATISLFSLSLMATISMTLHAAVFIFSIIAMFFFRYFRLFRCHYVFDALSLRCFRHYILLRYAIYAD